jgi:hypothetical protein
MQTASRPSLLQTCKPAYLHTCDPATLRPYFLFLRWRSNSPSVHEITITAITTTTAARSGRIQALPCRVRVSSDTTAPTTNTETAPTTFNHKYAVLVVVAT